MPKELFSKEEIKQIEAAIKQAETNTSGEIRVHIERHIKEDVLDHAAFIFEKLEMHKTELRNGVLFLVVIDDRQLAIIGDAGINAKVKEGFWDEIRDHMVENFKQGKYTKGLIDGILMAGKALKEHFPYDKKSDKNELSDEISFGK
ncbi:MAG: TPM domain-containing protein [Bacteroidia bacterium]